MIRSLAVVVIAYLAASAAVAVIAYNNAFKTELAATYSSGNVRLNEASSRLRGQLNFYRALVNIIAQDRRMELTLAGANKARVEAALKDFSLTFGAWEVDLVTGDGRIEASSHPERDGTLISKTLVTAAIEHRLGYEVVLENGKRLVRFSRGVRDQSGDSIGGIVVSADLSELEFEWPVTPEPIVFFDETQLSISSNRPDLLLLRNDGASEDAFPLAARKTVAGFELWTFRPKVDAKAEVMLLRRDIPQLELEGVVLLDTSSARATALLRTWLALAVMGVLGLIGAVMVQQRRRLALETQHSTTLEARVEDRTAELRSAQDALVEASKLAALGRLSAGVSHEINQPLAAILNFAGNAKKYLDKARPENARENLDHISDQVRRITRIIGNLRAFARQEVTATDAVDLVEITENSLKLSADDLSRARVDVGLHLPDAPVFVRGGRVRLEQVILNLVSNAVDAMQDAESKLLTVRMTLLADEAQLTISDTGHGIKDLDRVFEPFYTTKELGASKGMGMGLALSYGVITGFGGRLSCANTDHGAELTLTLPRLEGDQ